MRTAPLYRTTLLSLLALTTATCGDEAPAYSVPHTALEIDLQARTGRATIEVAVDGSGTLSLDIGDLAITAVTAPDGGVREYTAEDGMLHVTVPTTGETVQVVVEYTFLAHVKSDGWDPTAGLSFLWPYYCGNLYPCSSDPAEGQSFTLAVSGVPTGMTAVYPTSIPADAPGYMPAIAVGAFTEVALGRTDAGTEVVVWHLPGEEEAAAAGTAHMVGSFDFFEKTYGPYTFGDKVGTVSANWGPGAYGGMEHHPYWHVATDALADEEVNVHEAAHGWYGNGVRIACWEDFVLSEGTASYMAARALAEQGVDVWASYECRLKDVCLSADDNTVSLPTSCGTIDILEDPLWSDVPYMKGAYFFRAVADLIGEPAVDEVLADFYADHVGRAAQMEDMVAALATKIPAERAGVEMLAAQWLSTQACPIDTQAFCTCGPTMAEACE